MVISIDVTVRYKIQRQKFILVVKGFKLQSKTIWIAYGYVFFKCLFQGDYGGRYSLKNVFVTFQKAKLSCSDGTDYPFNFNEIRK